MTQRFPTDLGRGPRSCRGSHPLGSPASQPPCSSGDVTPLPAVPLQGPGTALVIAGAVGTEAIWSSASHSQSAQSPWDNVPSRVAGPLRPGSHTAHGLGTVTRPHRSPAAISTLLGHSTACRGHGGHVGDDRGEARAAAVGEGRWRPPSVYLIPCNILNVGFNPVQEGLGI